MPTKKHVVSRTADLVPTKYQMARRAWFLARMEKLGLTTTALADRLALDTTYISRVVNGHRTPSLEVAAAMATVLEVELDVLANVLVPAA